VVTVAEAAKPAKTQTAKEAAAKAAAAVAAAEPLAAEAPVDEPVAEEGGEAVNKGEIDALLGQLSDDD
jgi:hypothetical protein